MNRAVLVTLLTAQFLAPCLAQSPEPLGSIQARYKRERSELSQKLRTQKIELMKLMNVDDPSADLVKQKLDRILETERKRQYLFLDEMFSVRNSMTKTEWRDYRRSIIFMMMNKRSRP